MKRLLRVIEAALGCAVLAFLIVTGCFFVRSEGWERMAWTEWQVVTAVGPEIMSRANATADDAALYDYDTLIRLAFESNPSPGDDGIISKICRMRIPSVWDGRSPRRDLWDAVSERLVPIPLVDVDSSGGDEERYGAPAASQDVRLQVALFIAPSSPGATYRVTTYAWDGVTRESDGSPSLRCTPLYRTEEARKQGERRTGEFFAIAEAMWTAARDRDEVAFEKARALFKDSDNFSGLSGRQLNAMAKLLSKHRRSGAGEDGGAPVGR